MLKEVIAPIEKSKGESSEPVFESDKVVQCKCGHDKDSHFGYFNMRTNKNTTVCENCDCKQWERGN